MELDNIESDITTEQPGAALYEKPIDSRTQKADEQVYDTLKLEEDKTNEIGNQDGTLRRLKFGIYVMVALIIVLYISLISLIIVIFSSKEPVDGQSAQWSRLTSCELTCADGTQRCVNQVIAAKGGSDCIGESFQRNECSTGICSVDGQWARWSSWTSCDVTCGIGMRLRTRGCTNPVPLNNGSDCVGESLQSSQCHQKNCTAIMSAFSVTRPHNYIITLNRPSVTFSEIIYQYGEDFNISTGIYTCSIPGVYHFSATLIKKSGSRRADRIYCAFYKNNWFILYIEIDHLDEDTVKRTAAVSQSIVIELNIGDKVYLSSCNGLPDEVMEYWTSFTGVLIYRYK